MNPMYQKLLSYRYYRLDDSSSARTSRGMGKAKDCINHMALVLTKKFLGDDPILVLDFFAKYGQEADILGMSEAQAYIALPYFS